jgi:hypothetical protein
MRKAILPNCMALDILTAAQREICALMETEFCEYIPDNLENVSEVSRTSTHK